MWFERDKEFILKNYLLKMRLNGVIPRNKHDRGCSKKCLKEYKDLVIWIARFLFMF